MMDGMLQDMKKNAQVTITIVTMVRMNIQGSLREKALSPLHTHGQTSIQMV
jgi:hypothetical protein